MSLRCLFGHAWVLPPWTEADERILLAGYPVPSGRYCERCGRPWR